MKGRPKVLLVCPLCLENLAACVAGVHVVRERTVLAVADTGGEDLVAKLRHPGRPRKLSDAVSGGEEENGGTMACVERVH